jgi:hypothetical protein
MHEALIYLFEIQSYVSSINSQRAPTTSGEEVNVAPT